MKTMDLPEFAGLYCAKQTQTPVGLINRLKEQKAKWNPQGWVLLECVTLDSTRLGQLTILPYGPSNSLKAVPQTPISPRGLASDMSVVVGILPADQIQTEREKTHDR